MRRNARDGRAYRRARAQVLAAARVARGVCGVCLGPLGSGPLEADHVIRVRNGGGDEPANLRAVHPACNRDREREGLPPARIVVRGARA